MTLAKKSEQEQTKKENLFLEHARVGLVVKQAVALAVKYPSLLTGTPLTDEEIEGMTIPHLKCLIECRSTTKPKGLGTKNSCVEALKLMADKPNRLRESSVPEGYAEWRLTLPAKLLALEEPKLNQKPAAKTVSRAPSRAGSPQNLRITASAATVTPIAIAMAMAPPSPRPPASPR